MKDKYKKIKLRYGENPSQKANLVTNSSQSIFAVPQCWFFGCCHILSEEH